MAANRYTHTIPPEDYRQLLEYIERELASVSSAIDSIENGEKDVLYAQPARISRGLTVIADGSSWNPDGSGRFGQYIYNGTAWRYIGGGEAYGNISFPATQVQSADPNTLDDYEEGTWTPTITFGTPGNLNVVYSQRFGRYTKIGRLVTMEFSVVTSTFTHTTASGELTISSFPFTVAAAAGTSTLMFNNITKAGYTQFNFLVVGAASEMRGRASGSGVGISSIQHSDTPSGGALQLRGSVDYTV